LNHNNIDEASELYQQSLTSSVIHSAAVP